MAHIKVLSKSNSLLRLVYFVDGSVGRGCTNHRDDVYLVQFFLNALWGEMIEGKIIGSGPTPAIDGICGAHTVDAIHQFQRYYWLEPQDRFADGRIDVPAPGVHLGPRHQNPYTIIGLNTNFASAFGMERHTHLAAEPNFPAQLKPKLLIL